MKLSFDWQRKKNVLVSSPKILNEPATVSNLVGLELIGRRVHPDTTEQQLGLDLHADGEVVGLSPEELKKPLPKYLPLIFAVPVYNENITKGG